jgi:hypothetical protein
MRMKWVGHVACTGEKRNAYRLPLGKPEGKKQLRRPRRRCVNNINGWILQRLQGFIWKGLIWLRIETSGVIL